MRRLILAAAMLGLAVPQTADAAPKKRPAKSAAAKPKPVAAPVTPAKPGGFMVPREVTMKNMSPQEAEAHAIWNLRAGLNVAALQCQFSGFLRTVRYYNDFLKQHGDELARAQATLVGHFKRYDGARAANSFDQYTTRTYNSFSTLDAQYSFCAAAGFVGRGALVVPKDQLGPFALKRGLEMRAALADLPLSPALKVVPMEPLVIVIPDQP